MNKMKSMLINSFTGTVFYMLLSSLRDNEVINIRAFSGVDLFFMAFYAVFYHLGYGRNGRSRA